jgi:hypothetical protein
MKKERLFIRNFEGGSYLETFLITAVAAIRFILKKEDSAQAPWASK